MFDFSEDDNGREVTNEESSRLERQGPNIIGNESDIDVDESQNYEVLIGRDNDSLNRNRNRGSSLVEEVKQERRLQ